MLVRLLSGTLLTAPTKCSRGPVETLTVSYSSERVDRHVPYIGRFSHIRTLVLDEVSLGTSDYAL